MKTTKNNAEHTAIEKYRTRRSDVARLLDILQMELDKYTERAEAEPAIGASPAPWTSSAPA